MRRERWDNTGWMEALEPKLPLGQVVFMIWWAKRGVCWYKDRDNCLLLQAETSHHMQSSLTSSNSIQKTGSLTTPPHHTHVLVSLLFSTPTEALKNANCPAILLYINGILTACRMFGLVHQIYQPGVVPW